MKPFDLEAFKKGKKALTRNGRVATFVGVCEECYEDCQLIVSIDGNRLPIALHLNGMRNATSVGNSDLCDLVSMASRHQHLIDAYNPDDTWQWSRTGKNAWAADATPSWDEKLDYRLHPHNDLIKAWKKGAKIEKLAGEFGKGYVDDLNPTWNEYTHYRIKPEPTIHCLAYDAKRFDHEQTTAVRARVVKKEVAQANGWHIIQEWEV